jgi:hypothetical protein
MSSGQWARVEKKVREFGRVLCRSLSGAYGFQAVVYAAAMEESTCSQDGA